MDNNLDITAEAGEERLPMLPLRALTVFPDTSVSFDVERRRSVAAVEAASKGTRRIFLVAQRDPMKENPAVEDLYEIGVVCTLRQYVRNGDHGLRVIVEGVSRARRTEASMEGKYPHSTVSLIPREGAERTGRLVALMRNAVTLYDQYLTENEINRPEVFIGLTLRDDPDYTADYIAQSINISAAAKQDLLETFSAEERLGKLSRIMSDEINITRIERDINEKLRNNMQNAQRDSILREQLHIIQNELGEDDMSDVEEYRQKIAQAKLPGEVEEKLNKENERLAKQPFGSAEASVIRGYLDAVLALPWHTGTKERLDIAAARRILDKEHYGLEKVKDRIIEYLAVRKVAPDVKGAILCLVGPPGVGKTSVAMSIAHATNRKLARMSLGGIHDEAEIRGHRKTYVGAMPGRIMTAMTQSGSNNPVLLLDEIDKLGSDYRGDPSSALLEALDPVENTTFRDHFLEIPFDLSNVLFITTANTTDTIPRPLLDRMEVIELTSYTDEEKAAIAKRHLLPKQRKRHGLSSSTLRVSDAAIRALISGYTRESGVRQLEREIASLCRKADKLIATGEADLLSVRPDNLEALLGPKKFKPDVLAGKDAVGVVNGLAWTSVGGELLEVEAVCLEGTGKLSLTGNIGKVMEESAQAAVSCIRSRARALGIDPEFYKNRDIHIHFPEGAVPKDGPSAGVTIAVAAISALTGVAARRDVAMTGEITLTGRVLPIGGLKEKTMAALRYGVKTVIIPKENEKDLEEIDQTVRSELSFVLASTVDDVISAALTLPKAVG
ncbi:MAG: endopeptidase La [Oscillospiraceae bacterium]|nr:endopeptidase La [Oscillospiraceae bacterium]